MNIQLTLCKTLSPNSNQKLGKQFPKKHTHSFADIYLIDVNRNNQTLSKLLCRPREIGKNPRKIDARRLSLLSPSSTSLSTSLSIGTRLHSVHSNRGETTMEAQGDREGSWTLATILSNRWRRTDCHQRLVYCRTDTVICDGRWREARV